VRKALLEQYHFARFYVRLYGLGGGLRFAWGLMRCRSEHLLRVDLRAVKGQFDDRVNRAFDCRVVRSPEEFESVYEPYRAVVGRYIAAADRQRLASGRDILALAYRDGELAGWMWITKGPMNFGNRTLQATDCLVHRCRTLRPFRRQRLFATLLVHMHETLADEGMEWGYAGVKPFNTAPLRGFPSLGWEDGGQFVTSPPLTRLFRRLFRRRDTTGPWHEPG
jgi:hypothetical protein